MPLIFAAALALGIEPALADECARFEPAATQLAGRLIAREYAGPPDFSSVAAGDVPERIWILMLQKPLCVRADPGSTLNIRSFAALKEVQVVDQGASSDLVRLAGKEVEILGTLFAAHTGHHRTPVLLTIKTVRAARE
jgi:hypothetical protein